MEGIEEPHCETAKVDYGDKNYWNRRYADPSMGGSFDWLFEFAEVKEIIPQLVSKNDKVLMVGSGNADFSKDMYQEGYTSICNIDISEVVIESQRAAFPEMGWEVMDARNLPLADESVSCIIDKSLVDTMLCYSQSRKATSDFIREMCRVLAPGGVFISFSLHGVEEVVRYYTKHSRAWLVSPFRILNSRWSPEESRRSVAHSLIVCRKGAAAGLFPEPLMLTHVLSEDEHRKYLEIAKEVCASQYIENAPTEVLTDLLDRALAAYQKEKFPEQFKQFNALLIEDRHDADAVITGRQCDTTDESNEGSTSDFQIVD